MPSRIDANAENSRVKNSLPPDSALTSVAIFTPRPDRVKEPMIKPTIAQAIITSTAPFAPLANATNKRLGPIRVSFFTQLSAMVIRQAIKAAIEGLMPMIRTTTMDTRGSSR